MDYNANRGHLNTAAQRVGAGHVLPETAAAYAIKFEMYYHALHLLQIYAKNAMTIDMRSSNSQL